MDRLFETQKKTATQKAQEQNSVSEEKHEKISLHLKLAQEPTLQFDEQTFLVNESEEAPAGGEKAHGEALQNAQPAQNTYLQTFENKTVADILREDAQKQAAELQILEKQKESLAENSLDPNMTIGEFQKSAKENFSVQNAQKEVHESEIASQTERAEIVEQFSKENETQNTQENNSVIEKPNYDFLQEPKKTIKLSKKSEKTKQKRSSKKAGIVLACALAGSAVICVGNAVLIDQMSASFVQIDETYKFNLAKYLKSISNLDATKKSMDFLETYPDDLLKAGDLGEKSNWFDRFCNFLGGLFGG